MPSTYSPNLRLELIEVGGQPNSWGSTTNVNLGSLIESAIAGNANIDLADSDYTLTSRNGATDESRNMILTFTSSGGLTASRNITIPSVSKVYVVRNSTTQSLVFKTASSVTTASVPAGAVKFIYCDGVDVRDAGGTASAVTSVSANSPLQSSGGTAPTISFQTNPTITGNVTFPNTVTFNTGTSSYTMPIVRPSVAGQVLTGDTAGNLYWSTVTSGGGGGGGVTSVASSSSNLLVNGGAGPATGAISLSFLNNPTFTSNVTAGSVSTNTTTANVFSGPVSCPSLTVNGVTYPTTAGVAGQYLVTNGTNAASWTTLTAALTNGSNASGTWPISITGNAATVTNGVYTTGSYSNPAWITTLAGSKISGAVASAATSGTCTGNSSTANAASSYNWEVTNDGTLSGSVHIVGPNTALPTSGVWYGTTSASIGVNGNGALVFRSRNAGNANSFAFQNNAGTVTSFYATADHYTMHLGSYSGAALHIGDASGASVYSQGIYNTFLGSAIGVYVNSSGQLGQLSSTEKLKTAITNVTKAEIDNVIANLRPITYKVKFPKTEQEEALVQYGFIAEEVAAVDDRLTPKAKYTFDDNGARVELDHEVPVTVDYARLSVVLLAKVQELEARIKELEAK